MDTITKRLIGTIIFSVFFGFIAFYQAETTLKAHKKSMAVSDEPVTDKRVLILVADGSEDMEVAMTFDILKRTAGLDVALVGVYGEQTLSDSSSDSLPLLKFAKGMQVQPDLKIQDVTSQPDLVVIPGGYIGVKNIRENPISKNLILNQINSGKKLAAICAGPLVILDLLTENSLDLKTASGQAKTSLELTSWPKFEADFKNLQVSLPNEAKVNSISWVGYDAGNLGVVVDENIITSQGPGTTMSFAVKILEELDIPVEEIEKVKAGILYGL